MRKTVLLISFFSLLIAFPADAQKWMNRSSIYMASIPTEQKSEQKSGYQGELNFGYVADGDYSRPFMESIHGVNIKGYAFAGVGFGLQYAYNEKWNNMGIPLFVNLKGMYPVSEDFSPYITLSLGYNFLLFSESKHHMINYIDGLGGFYNDLGVGIKYKAFNLSLGMQVQKFNIDSNEMLNYYNRDAVYELFYADGTYEEGEEISKLKNVGFYVKLGVMF